MQWMGLENREWKAMQVFPKDHIVRACFSCEMEFPGDGRALEIKVACVNRYKLYINDALVQTGPCRAPFEMAFADTVDIGAFLKRGRNRLVFLVEAYPVRPDSEDHTPPMNAYGYDLGPMLALACEAVPDLAEPSSWKVVPDPAFSPDYSGHEIVGPMERLDFRRRGAAGQGAACPQILGDAGSNIVGEIKFPEIRPRPIPMLMTKEVPFAHPGPVCVQKGTCVTVRFWWDELMTGYPLFAFSGGKDARVTFCYAESVFFREGGNYVKRVRDDPAGEVRGLEDTLILSGGDRNWEPFNLRTCRVIEMRAECAGEDLTVTPVLFRETRYPLECRADVRSSEDWVERLFAISLRTLGNCMHDSYEDCPYYEQMMYDMDTRLEALFTHAVSLDTRLSRHAIALFSASRRASGLLQSRYPSRVPQVIPGFSLYWIEMLCDDYGQTGDKDFCAPYIPLAQGILEAFMDRVGSDGMVPDMGYWEFADWAPQWDGTAGVPAALKQGPSALHNLHLCYTMNRLCALLEALGRREEAGRLRTVSGRIQMAVHNACWDPEQGMVREGKNSAQFSQHTQVWAVLSGLLEGDRARRALEQAMTRPEVVPCSFVMRYYLFRALEAAGMYEKTIPLWEGWKSLLPLHCSTVPEEPFHPRSDCHGWGALALYEFPVKLLGVDRAGDGWKGIRLRPRPDLMDDLAGTVPTPFGPVFVAWTRKDHRHVHLWVRVPREAENVSLALPDGKPLPLEDGAFDSEIVCEKIT